MLNDFLVYHSASSNFIHGQNVYGLSYGLSSGYYKYSPFSLLFFGIFALIPFSIAKFIWYIACSVFYVATIWLCSKIMGVNFKNTQKNTFFYLSIFVVSLTHLYRELHLGNINLFIDCLLLISFILYINSKSNKSTLYAAILYGIVVLFKPHFLILLPLFLFRTNIRFLIYSIGSILIGLLIPTVIIGFQKNMLLLSDWLATMKAHNQVINTSHHTISALLTKILPSLNTINPFILGISIISILGISFLFIYLIHRKKEKYLNSKNNNNFYFEIILLLAIVPNITVTDTEHFLYTLPLIIWILNELFNGKKHNIFLIALVILSFVLYGGNITELVGRKISSQMDDLGLLGIGNLLLIGTSIWMKFQKQDNGKISKI